MVRHDKNRRSGIFFRRSLQRIREPCSDRFCSAVLLVAGAVLPQRDDRDAANLDNLVGFLPGILFESIAGSLAAAFVVADAPDRLTLGVVRMILFGLEQRRILRFGSAVGNVAHKYLRGICRSALCVNAVKSLKRVCKLLLRIHTVDVDIAANKQARFHIFPADGLPSLPRRIPC